MLYTISLAINKVSFPGLGINDITINSVAFTIGSLTVYWYGVMLALAVATCACLGMWQAKKHQFTADHVIDFVLVCFPSALIGARLYYVFSEWDNYKGDPMSILRVKDGGLAVIGGVLAAILAGWILAKVKKLPPNIVFDFCVVYIPVGQAIGRWGNFFNQEAFGTNTDLPWGMISESTSRYLREYWPSLNPDLPVHPTFLYESIASVCLFFVLLLIRNKSKYSFTTTSAYFILYGIIRYFLEGLRTDSLYIGDTGLRTSQVVSVLMIASGLILIAVSRYRGWKRSILPVPVSASKEAISDKYANASTTDDQNTSDSEEDNKGE